MCQERQIIDGEAVAWIMSLAYNLAERVRAHTRRGGSVLQCATATSS